jgi:hypothetical protein
MHGYPPKYYNYIYSNTVVDKQFDANSNQMTHTMNIDLIKKVFPEHKVVKIKSDMKKSLLRQWEVYLKYNMGNNSELDMMYKLIVWHANYYSENGFDYDCDELVDIDTDPSEFGKIMRRELSISNLKFDVAWQAFLDYGSDAPILSIEKSLSQDKQ